MPAASPKTERPGARSTVRAPGLAEMRLARATCEIRYPPAFLLWDRTGSVAQTLQSTPQFEAMRVPSAAPNQTIFEIESASCNLEITAARCQTNEADAKLEGFSEVCSVFMSTACRQLEVRELARVGLRTIHYAAYRSEREMLDAMLALGFERRLGAAFRDGNDVIEVSFRWQGPESGTTMRLVVSSGTVGWRVVLPVEEQDRSRHEVTMNHLVVDTDFFVNGPAKVSQWDSATWIEDALRQTRLRVGSVLGGGGAA